MSRTKKQCKDPFEKWNDERIIAAYKKEEAAVLKRKAKRRATRKAKGDKK
jgi:hypothetical protein